MYETTQQAEDYAAKKGIILTPADRARLTQIQQAARRQAEETAPPDSSNSWADKWNQFYPRLLESVIHTGDVILTLTKTLIVNLGIPVALVLLLVVEHQRVVHGIALFETDYGLASFMAWALVVLNLVLEFQVHHIEHKANYEQERDVKWSIRVWWSNMAYKLGLGDEWTEQQLSPAQRYRRLLSLVTITIVSLALLGSMRVVIEETDGVWYQAVVSILTESNLLLMLTWTGGTLLTLAAVLSAQGLSRYVAIQAVEIVARMEENQHDSIDPHADAVERAGAQFVVALAKERLAEKKKQAESAQRRLELEMMNTDDEDTEPIPTVNPT